MKVFVTEKNRQIVQVTMPAMQVSDLTNLNPDEVMEKVQEAGIDVDHIGGEACRNGVQPLELFRFLNGEREYKVWLE